MRAVYAAGLINARGVNSDWGSSKGICINTQSYKKALKVVTLDTQAYYEFAKYVTAAYPVSCTVL